MAAEQDRKDPHTNERITVRVFDSWSRQLSVRAQNYGSTRPMGGTVRRPGPRVTAQPSVPYGHRLEPQKATAGTTCNATGCH